VPELPEVETMCRGIRPIVGGIISSVTVPKCQFRPIQIEPKIRTIDRRLAGECVDRVSRLGKRVVVHAGKWRLVLQPKMTGLVVIDSPPDFEHVRLIIELMGSQVTRMMFWDRRGLGTVQLVTEKELVSKIAAGRLGPDALSISANDFATRLTATRRPVKVALLDQHIVAGVGNLYASEVLHVAKINPACPASQLSKPRLALLHQSMQEILTTAIAYEGSTLSDGAYRNALNNPGAYQNAHRVYDRENQLCLSCSKSQIKRIVQAQRSTFYCPNCQRR